MRCPNCNRFVSYGEQDPELDISELKGTTITVDVRVVLPCDTCSTELKDYNDDVEFDLSGEFDFSLQPTVKWGEMEIFGQRYYTRRAQSPDTQEWFVNIFRIEKSWISGPRNRLGRPDHDSPEAVFEDQRRHLKEFVIQPGYQALDGINSTLQNWAMEIWNKERFNIEEESVEFFSDYKGSGRFLQTFYGADFSVKVEDRATSTEHIYTGHVQEQASSFDELV